MVAETFDGHFWAIQAKAVAPNHTISKAEIDSFLSESNRRQISFRLLIATTDELSSNARRTIGQQEKLASFLGRGDLLSADIVWPAAVGGKAIRLLRAKPKPHQEAAIAAALRGFHKHSRGRLIMACGTGKTLTGLWIHERLKSRRTLILVPSISLVQQNLREWGRHAHEHFDCLVVCSDESVAGDSQDPAMRCVAELGIDVTTDAADIARFLAQRRTRPAVVITTYQSSDRVSAGQNQSRKTFELALCDEAHRLVGDMRGRFATILDDRKIRCRRRLFMTATPRYFTQRARRRAADQALEVASMDDSATFGPEFHVLGFYDAITAKPTPLLTDYRVLVIGVTDDEVAEWAKQGKLIRTGDGTETDARTLAAQIGLAKAMREYDLRRLITFHRSIRRASRFVDSDRNDSLPAVVDTLPTSARPPGILWTRHISGETPASKRIATLRALAELPDNTRGLISNCACLGEGVDVPALDGIAFIDPKGSVVEIIQAVGRVIRLSPDKAIGTIVIPVFVDQSTDAAHALTHSSFDPVWQVLKALRAHDQRLADELDSLRTADGKGIGGCDRLRLPHNVVIEAKAVLLPRFADAFYVRVVENTTQPVTQKDLLLDLMRTHSVVRSRDFERAGVSRVAVQRALASGTIVQQARGVYSLPHIVADRTQEIAFVALKTPRAIVCLLTAAELHGMANESSERIWVMVDKSAHKPVDPDGRMAIVRASGAALTTGVVHLVRGKQQLKVTSPAKTVADFFRYRATVGEDAAITILKTCLRLKKATAEEILEMAEVDRVARIVQPYLKALA